MTERMINNLFSVYVYVAYLLLFIVVPQDIHSWDLAVANEGGINFFDFQGKVEISPKEFHNLNDLYVLAYDSFHQRIFFSVIEHNTSIFAYNLTDNELTPLVPRQSHEVQGIAHDVATQTLFWTDGNGHSIWKKSLHNDSSPPEILISFKTDIPTGITISFCKRLLFWTNSNHLSASIDRSNLDGSNHEKLLSTDIFLPLAITIDEVYGKLYWTDDQQGIYYRIERSNLDGTDRELVIQRTNQEPFGIAATNKAIYWTDTIQKNVWMLSSDMSFPNHTMAKLEPEVFYNFKQFTPYGIVAFSDGIFECDLVVKVPSQKVVFYSNEEEPPQKSEVFSSCLNNGDFVGNICKCKKGFTGKQCETSVCHNYCLNGGQCFLDEAGFAECQCLPGYKGVRCDLDVCDGYCLNGGRCLVNSSVPLCSCGSRFLGQRCETSMDFVCEQICSYAIENPMCDCNSTKWSYEASSNYIESLHTSHCQQQNFLTIFLLSFGATAMLVIVVLSRKVCILRRRPRIKKRIIVNKGVKSQTPMTARPNADSAEQCEITIENCCNMNICETPCFEPNLRSSLSSSSQFSKKSEDRKNLLKNMEEDFGNPDVSYS